MLTSLVFGIETIKKEALLKGMKKAASFFHSLSIAGGYAGSYSPDLQQRYGYLLKYFSSAMLEVDPHRLKANEIFVYSWGTPRIGQMFLKAYLLTGDNDYLAWAEKAAKSLAKGQREDGGWSRYANTTTIQKCSEGEEKWMRRLCVLDETFREPMHFLMKLDGTIRSLWLTETIEKGMKFVVRSQFENGAWPKVFPLQEGYTSLYAFNNQIVNGVIDILLKAYFKYNKPEYLQAAERGGQFILASQLLSPQSGWAQQYSHDLKPSWGRAYEPPAVCSKVTASNIVTLIKLYIVTGRKSYLAPIPSAIAWLEKSKIAPNRWARLYEFETNKPIYGDRDRKIHYTLEEISKERRDGYVWQGGFGIEQAIVKYRALTNKNVKPKDWESFFLENKEAPSIRQIASVLERQDKEGRWGSGQWNNKKKKNDQGEWIHSRVFIRNFERLLDSLENNVFEVSVRK